jgi:hypothetical protein
MRPEYFFGEEGIRPPSDPREDKVALAIELVHEEFESHEIANGLLKDIAGSIEPFCFDGNRRLPRLFIEDHVVDCWAPTWANGRVRENWMFVLGAHLLPVSSHEEMTDRLSQICFLEQFCSPTELFIPEKRANGLDQLPELCGHGPLQGQW